MTRLELAGGAAMGQMSAMSLRIRLFHLWFRLSRPMTLGVRIAAFDTQGRVLLVRHSYVKGWHLPGGGVDAGETLCEAASRELAEETGISVAISGQPVSVHFNRQASRRDHVALYVVRGIQADDLNVPGREIIEAGFFAADGLPDGTSAATITRLAELAGRAEVSPYW